MDGGLTGEDVGFCFDNALVTRLKVGITSEVGASVGLQVGLVVGAGDAPIAVKEVEKLKG